MSFTKCVYHNCNNISRDISMFRFPIHDQGRLILWIQNSGNIYLDSLTNEELRCRYICAAHFPASSIHQGQIRSRLIGPAVPVHFRVEVGEQTTNQRDMNVENDVIPSPEVLKVKTPTKIYRKRKRSPSVPEEESTSSPTMLYKERMDVATPTRRMSRKCMFEGPKRRLSRKCLFESNVDDTPKTKFLKNAASTLLKKNRAQKSRIGRLQIKSKRNQSIETADFRTVFSKTIAVMQLRKKNEKKKWTSDKYKCETCTANLFQEINLEDKNQILILNKAYDCSRTVNLKMPSNGLLKLVQLAIDCFNVHFNDNKHSKKIKLRLFNTVLNHVKCESPELLTISCENHLLCIIDHLILVKIHFYCKSNKYSNLEHTKSSGKVNPKLRILQNK